MAAKGPSSNKSQTVETATQAAQTESISPTTVGAAIQEAQAKQAAQQSQPQPTQQTRTEQYKGTSTMSNQNQNILGAGFMESFKPRYSVIEQGDADAAVLTETIRAIQKNNESSANQAVQFITVPKSVTGNFTAMVVGITSVVDGVSFTGIYTYLLEASRPPLETLTQPGQNGAIEVVLSPADAYTADFVALVQKEVSRQVAPGSKIIDAGMQIIYRETQITDQTAVGTMLNEATQAIDATLRSLDAREHGRRFGLELVVKNPSVRIQSKFSLDEKRTQANGLPLRSDITAELIMQQSSNKQQTIQSNTSVNLAKCGGFVDLVYVAPTQMFGNAFAGQQQQYHYVPRITMTDLSTEMAGSTLEFLLLAVANMTSLNRNRAYGVQFRDSYNHANEGSLRNLGAIGWQMPHLGDGQPGNLVIESDQQLQQLIHTAIDPRPVYTLEVGQAGHNSWLLEAFARSANSELSANNDILDAGDNLTGGRLRPILAQLLNQHPDTVSQIPVIRATQDLNHIGYYKSPKTGGYEDIRELDLVAILNIANGNIDLVRDYLSTCVTTTGEHPLQRLDRRLRIFRNICSEVVIKGYATKYDFNGLFIEALIKAIEGTGFVLNASNTLLTSQEQVYTQTIQDWASVMVNPSVGSGLYQTQGFQPQGNIYNVGQNFGFGGWNR